MAENVVVRNEVEFRKHCKDYHSISIQEDEELEDHIQSHHIIHGYYSTHSHEPDWDGENRASRIFVIAENHERYVRAAEGAGFDFVRDRHKIFRLLTVQDAVALRERRIEWEEWDQVLYAGIPDIPLDFFDVLRSIGFPAPEVML